MSKYDEISLEEELALESAVEASIDQGPAPAFVGTGKVGTAAEILQTYSHCGVCGGRLHFNFVSDFSRNTTHEKASCPECGVEARQVLHRLQ
jgi:hypothetical protein